MIYGEKLKYLREEKELTQKDLGDLIEVHAATYSQFERESSIIPINVNPFLKCHHIIS